MASSRGVVAVKKVEGEKRRGHTIWVVVALPRLVGDHSKKIPFSLWAHAVQVCSIKLNRSWSKLAVPTLSAGEPRPAARLQIDKMIDVQLFPLWASRKDMPEWPLNACPFFVQAV